MAENKSGDDWNVRREICCIYKLSITNLTWTSIWLDTIICGGKPKLWCILLSVFTGKFYIFNTGNKFLTSESTISLELSVSGNLCWHSGNYSLSLQRIYIKYKLAYIFTYTVTDVGGWRGTGGGNIVLCWVRNITVQIWMDYKNLSFEN